MPDQNSETILLTDLPEEWQQEIQRLRQNTKRLREKAQQEMDALAGLVERFVKKEIDLPLVLLAFHHVAMGLGSMAQKRTLRIALASSIEVLSREAPAIYPPDRIPGIADAPPVTTPLSVANQKLRETGQALLDVIDERKEKRGIWEIPECELQCDALRKVIADTPAGKGGS